MNYTHEVEQMCVVAKGPHHGPAPIPEEGLWVKAKQIGDISGLTHGVGWCAPQQGACKLTLNIKKGIVEEALVETLGCSGMTHSAAMAAEILPGKTILECLNTDLVCDAINTAMRELFLQIVYGRSQSAFSEDGLSIGAGLEDLGKGVFIHCPAFPYLPEKRIVSNTISNYSNLVYSSLNTSSSFMPRLALKSTTSPSASIA